MEKPLVWLRGEVKTPPFSQAARLEAGNVLRLLQQGESLGLPHSRPMPVIGPRCMSCGSTMSPARFASYTGQILTRWLVLMC